MLKIRLKRVGKRNQASFRIVVMEKSRSPESGKVVETVGFYNPHDNTKELNKERVSYWLGEGVKPSDTVHNILVDEGLLSEGKINVLPRKSPILKEEESDKSSESEEKDDDKMEDEDDSQEKAEEKEEVKEDPKASSDDDARASEEKEVETEESGEESGPEESKEDNIEDKE